MKAAQNQLQAWATLAFARLLREPVVRAAVREFATDVVERIPLPICVVREPALRIEIANSTFRSLTSVRDVIGRSLRDTVTGECARRLMDGCDECMRTGSFRCRTVELESAIQNLRHERCYDWLCCPLAVRPGSAGVAVVVGYDVTLHIEARQRTELALRCAEQAREMKEDFFAQAAHELRSPLVPIVTSVEILRGSHPDGLDHQYRVIERQVKHLTRLIQDLVDLSSKEFRGIGLKRERVLLSTVLDAALELSGPLLAAHGHGIELDIDRTLCVYGDPCRLLQIVSNLVTNSAKYMADGGSIRIAAGQTDGEIVLSVIDSGIGIAPDMLPRVFERFVQASDVQPRSHGGVGLGLHVVRTLVREHGGSIEAHSDGPGRGSRFTVRLPSAMNKALAAAALVQTRELGSCSPSASTHEG